MAACRELFLEYQQSLGISLCFQGFDAEVAGLPGDYAIPRGGLWLATVDGALAGCVALRALGDDAAEMKRLYVRPAFRSRRLGLALAEHVIAAARERRYRTLKLDTLPSMARAQQPVTPHPGGARAHGVRDQFDGMIGRWRTSVALTM